MVVSSKRGQKTMRYITTMAPAMVDNCSLTILILISLFQGITKLMASHLVLLRYTFWNHQWYIIDKWIPSVPLVLIWLCLNVQIAIPISPIHRADVRHEMDKKYYWFCNLTLPENCKIQNDFYWFCNLTTTAYYWIKTISICISDMA